MSLAGFANKGIEDEEKSKRAATRRILNPVENILFKQEKENLDQESPASDSSEVFLLNPEVSTPTVDFSDIEAREDISDYEKMRLKNIREREEMFHNLHLDKLKTRLSDAFAHKKPSAASKRGLLQPKKEKEVLPLRKSARLAGGKVAEIDRFVPDQPAEPEEVSLPLRTLKLSETCEKDGQLLQQEAKFLSELSVICKQTSTKDEKGAGSFGSTVADYKDRLKEISITPERVAKVVPDRIFSLAVHPGSEKVLVAVGGKWGGVGLWDALDAAGPQNGVHLYVPHRRPVNCLTWDQFNPCQLISTSYDGTSRIFDLEKQQHRLLYGDEDFLDAGGYTTAHSQIDAHTFLVTKGKTGMVGVVDTRKGAGATVQDLAVLERISPKCVDLHPLQRDIFLVANNRSGCFLFDIRSARKSKLMEPVCELAGHGKSISSALFSPLTGNKVITVAYDDRLRLFNTTKLAGLLTSQETKHNNQTGRWLTPFKACWHPRKDDLVLTGSMSWPREIEVWHAVTALTRIHHLKGEDLASICSIISVHPTREVVVGGNSSGRVHLFM